MASELIWDINEKNVIEFAMLVDHQHSIRSYANAPLGSVESNTWFQSKHALENFLNKIATVPSSAMVYQ